MQASKATQEAPNADFKLEELVDDLERRARKWLEAADKWVNQGDDLLSKAKIWLDEHPVVSGVVTKYGRRIQGLPSSVDEAKVSARDVGERLRHSAREGFESARAHPLDVFLIGSAIGLIAWVAVKGR